MAKGGYTKIGGNDSLVGKLSELIKNDKISKNIYYWHYY